MVVAQEPRQADAVLARHVEVEDHQVEVLLAEELAQLRTVLGHLDVESVAAQIAVQHETHVRIVVDDQDAWIFPFLVAAQRPHSCAQITFILHSSTTRRCPISAREPRGIAWPWSIALLEQRKGTQHVRTIDR